MSSTPLLALSLAATAASPEGPGLDAAVKAVSVDALAAIRLDQAARAGDRGRLFELGERMILPHVDATGMTRLAMSRVCQRADAEQEQRLASQFAQLVVHAYAAALAGVADQEVIISRVRATTRADNAAARFEIGETSAQPVVIDYTMVKSPEGWKVHDIKVSGVSLVTLYQPTFSEVVRNHGIEGLIRLLADRNSRKSRQVAPARVSVERLQRLADAAVPAGARRARATTGTG